MERCVQSWLPNEDFRCSEQACALPERLYIYIPYVCIVFMPQFEEFREANKTTG